jgi:hypothetical protein
METLHAPIITPMRHCKLCISVEEKKYPNILTIYSGDKLPASSADEFSNPIMIVQIGILMHFCGRKHTFSIFSPFIHKDMMPALGAGGFKIYPQKRLIVP